MGLSYALRQALLAPSGYSAKMDNALVPAAFGPSRKSVIGAPDRKQVSGVHQIDQIGDSRLSPMAVAADRLRPTPFNSPARYLPIIY
jgi:hypothetical protein